MAAKERKIEHEKYKASIRTKLQPLEDGIVEQRRIVDTRDRDISALAFAVAAGDQSALKKMKMLREQKQDALLLSETFQKSAGELRQELAAAELKTSDIGKAAVCESLAVKVSELNPFALKVRKAVAELVRASEEFGEHFVPLVSESIALIGDTEQTRRLTEQARVCFLRGLRAELATSFGAVGLRVLDAPDGNFEQIVGPVISNLIAALSIEAPVDEERARFHFRENTSGLFGLAFVAGSEATLPIRDQKVQQLVANGVIEKIDAKSGKAAA
jgi:hypothetical protein